MEQNENALTRPDDKLTPVWTILDFALGALMFAVGLLMAFAIPEEVQVIPDWIFLTIFFAAGAIFLLGGTIRLVKLRRR